MWCQQKQSMTEGWSDPYVVIKPAATFETQDLIYYKLSFIRESFIFRDSC